MIRVITAGYTTLKIGVAIEIIVDNPQTETITLKTQMATSKVMGMVMNATKRLINV